MEDGFRKSVAMGLQTRRCLSLEEKPLPLLPHSPTLTNPDMVLPDSFPDTTSFSTPPRRSRPPSPSYLVERREQDRQASLWDVAHRKSHASPTREQTCQHSRQSSEGGSDRGPVLQASPARRAQYRYSEAAFGSSPTVSSVQMPWSRTAKTADDSHRLSAMTTSSIDSDDLDAIRFPAFTAFAGRADDSETVDDTELDEPSPSERWRSGEQMEPPETEESAVTLMRAEMILANAKKRLNLMDQNLRGAREMVAPLTAANLKRATSLSSAFTQPAYYGRPRYITAQQPDELPQVADVFGHSRVFSDSAASQVFPERPVTSLSRNVIPVRNFTPSWTSNPLRGSKSSEQLRGGARLTPRLHANSPVPQLEPLAENESTVASVHHSSNMSCQSSSTTDLREQMDELKGRISSLAVRAREDSLRRRSTQNLRQACPLVNSNIYSSPAQQSNLRRTSSSAHVGRHTAALSATPSPPRTEDGQLIFDPNLGYAALSPTRRSLRSPSMDDDTVSSLTESYQSSTSSPSRTITDTSEDGESNSIYEDAPNLPLASQRHEDREDAFDYGNLFLHSSMGTFSRPRGSSFTSTDSGETARGPISFDLVPSTPETPEHLRDIERSIHRRALSAESILSAASFTTAQEGIKSGRATPMATPDLFAPRSKDGRSTALSNDKADSGVVMAEQSKVAAVSRPTRGSLSLFPSIPQSAESVAVSALLDVNARPLGLKDKALVFTLVESLRHICEELQHGDESGDRRRILRQRLEQASRVLDGKTQGI
ncbi:hypothetical protein BDV97DRAFT_21832 [Delphinella strobiligena]|nr:hypothetical protein BDV97DRAFT_21832 [Delphinella strobiligena]